MPSKSKIATLLAAPLLILSFQNCSDFSLSDQILYEQALMESREALDAEQLPLLLSSSTLYRWYKTSDNNYKNDPASGDQMSMIIALPRTSTGKVLYVNSAADTEEGSITITGGKIQAARTNASPAYSEMIEADVPSSGDNMVLTASFGAKAGELSLLVNGKVISAAITTSGTPADFTTGARNIFATGSPIEFMVYVGDSATNAVNGKLTTAQQNVMARYLANNNSIPNVIFDPVVVGGVSGGDGGGGDGGVVIDRFAAAKTVLENNGCVACHNGNIVMDLRSYTQAKALANGDVVKGNLAASKLYYRLTAATVGPGPKSMPQGGTISASDAQVIADWITNIP